MATLDIYLKRLEVAYWPARYASAQPVKTNPPVPVETSELPPFTTRQRRSPRQSNLSTIEQMYADYDRDPTNYKQQKETKISLIGVDVRFKRKRCVKLEVRCEEVGKLVSAKLLKEIREHKKHSVKKRFSTPACMLQFRLEELTHKNDRKLSLKKCLEVPDLKYMKGFNTLQLEREPPATIPAVSSSSSNPNPSPGSNPRRDEASDGRAQSVSPCREGNVGRGKLSLIDKLNLYYDDDHMAKLFGVMSIPEGEEKQDSSEVQNFHDLKRAKLNEEENKSKTAVKRWRKEADEQWSSLENFLGAPTTASHYWHHLSFCKQRFQTKRTNSLLFRRKPAVREKPPSPKRRDATAEPLFNLFANKVAFASVLKFRRRLAAIRAARAEFEDC